MQLRTATDDQDQPIPMALAARVEGRDIDQREQLTSETPVERGKQHSVIMRAIRSTH